MNHIWGEHEVGGTSVLYISDVELTAAGWPESLPGHAVPELATTVLSTVPATFLTVGAAMAGIHWIVRRIFLNGRWELIFMVKYRRGVKTQLVDDIDIV